MSRNASVRPGIHRLFQQFVHSEVTGSILLLLCTLLALVWANSPWADAYDHLLHVKLGVSWDGQLYALTLHHWINDGLMVIFFFVVGLEVKRELLVGHLASFQQAMLPVAAAAGGMLVPAAVYAVLNLSGDGRAGWGIPMATDIAFALGVLAMFGKRVPVSLKVFVAAAAIADDIGAVLVIAMFYTETIRWTALLIAGLLLLALLFVTRVWKVHRLDLILVLVIGVWLAVFVSGIHATIAGILVAFLVPVTARIDPKEFLTKTEERLQWLKQSELTRESMVLDERQLGVITELHDATRQLEPAGLALEHFWHPVLVFFVLPLFALANAGVSFGDDALAKLLSPVGLGVLLGLVVGKQVGIAGASWLVIRFGGARLPAGTNWQQLYGVSCLTGIGFTMSLFITELAFKDPALVVEAKMGILAGSLIAGIMGAIALSRSLPTGTDSATSGEAAEHS